jgi:spore coat polysaccharide biosynthesis predicted glycosyltransferase SpsG
MGGADEFNFTQRVAELLLRERPNLNLNIIVGAGYNDLETLVSVTEKFSDQCTVQHNITDMLEQYLATDVAVAAGGLTASELAASHTPAILIATYEHQIERCRYFHGKGWGVYLGFRSFDENLLLERVDHVKMPDSWPCFKPQKILEISNEFKKI